MRKSNSIFLIANKPASNILYTTMRSTSCYVSTETNLYASKHIVILGKNKAVIEYSVTALYA